MIPPSSLQPILRGLFMSDDRHNEMPRVKAPPKSDQEPGDPMGDWDALRYLEKLRKAEAPRRDTPKQ